MSRNDRHFLSRRDLLCLATRIEEISRLTARNAICVATRIVMFLVWPRPELSCVVMRNKTLSSYRNYMFQTSVWVTFKMWWIVCLSNPRKSKFLSKMLQLQYVWGKQSSKQVGLVQCQQYAQDNRAWGSTPTKEKYIRALLKSREGAAAWVF